MQTQLKSKLGCCRLEVNRENLISIAGRVVSGSSFLCRLFVSEGGSSQWRGSNVAIFQRKELSLFEGWRSSIRFLAGPPTVCADFPDAGCGPDPEVDYSMADSGPIFRAKRAVLVLPLMPEFITPQAGAERQDRKRNAVKRRPTCAQSRPRPAQLPTECASQTCSQKREERQFALTIGRGRAATGQTLGILFPDTDPRHPSYPSMCNRRRDLARQIQGPAPDEV